jgi:hypothetical protein
MNRLISLSLYIYEQHEILAAVARGTSVILCTSHPNVPQFPFYTSQTPGSFLTAFTTFSSLFLPFFLSGNHSNTERPYLRQLRARLQAALDDIVAEDVAAGKASSATKYEVVVSEVDRDPLEFV